jgi:hypothetical protein
MRDFAVALVLRASRASHVRKTKTGSSAETRSEAEGKIKADAKTGLRAGIASDSWRRWERPEKACLGVDRGLHEERPTGRRNGRP